MIRFDQPLTFELIYVIVNYGMGSRILHKAKEYGIPGGSILLGKGSVNNALLNFLSLYEQKKEIVLLGTDSHTASHVLDELNKDFAFEKPNHGIVFTTSACEIAGSRCYTSRENKQSKGGYQTVYHMILTIVNRGKAEEVIDAAKAAGSEGGTIINARGSGIHENSKLFHMEIEPEKEIVIILSKKHITESIVSSIREKLDIDTPGNGIMFIQDINKAYGMYES